MLYTFLHLVCFHHRLIPLWIKKEIPNGIVTTFALAIIKGKVILLFPDTTSMTDFILAEQITHPEVNSREQSLTAELTDQQITIAITRYNAVLVYPNQSHSSNPSSFLWF